jgi:hypothetical protein
LKVHEFSRLDTGCDSTSEYDALKNHAQSRIRGRVLVGLAKNVTMNSNTAFIRWYVRTHKKIAKRTITQFVIRSKISSQVAFWRFKWMAAPGKKRRQNFA